tara:strand:+ start:5134 stop:6009 length:876 start_codon:yes stop_codon:yes gene_type:complete
MDFKIGFNVKPKVINAQNQVIFEKWATSGESRLIDTPPTRYDCEGYGFIWNGNKCFCYPKNTQNSPSLSDNISISAGVRNTSARPSNQLSFVGLDNLVRNDCFNDLIVGNNNDIDRAVSNSIIFGSKSYATSVNSLVQGGNTPLNYGEVSANTETRQNTVLMYGRNTTNGSTKTTYINNTTGQYFYIPINTIMYFNAEIVAVRVGGTGAGSVGDYASWVERGVIINKGGTSTINRERDTIKSSGTVSNWRPTAAAGASNNFYIAVRGDTDVNINWASTIRFTEIRTNVDLS